MPPETVVTLLLVATDVDLLEASQSLLCPGFANCVGSVRDVARPCILSRASVGTEGVGQTIRRRLEAFHARVVLSEFLLARPPHHAWVRVEGWL